MKIKNIAIIILMTTLFIMIGTKAFATTGEINSKEANLRKQPNDKATILDIVYKGDEVEILEQQEGWYKVKAKTSLGKVTGYISANSIDVQEETKEPNKVEDNANTEMPEETNQVTPPKETEQPTTEITQGVTTLKEIQENNQYALQQELSVKSLPLINSIEKAKLKGNITVIEIINDWARIESDVDSGWVRKNTLKNMLTEPETTEPEQQPEEQPTENKTEETKPEQPATEVQQQPEQSQESETIEMNKVGYVSTDGLRVRKGPSTDTDEINSLSKNDKVEIIGQTGKWYKIKIKGEIGYVSAKYISDTKVAETTSRSGSTLKNETIPQAEETPKVEENPVPEPIPEPEITQPEPSAPESAGTTGAAIVEYAKQYLGYKYVSGGTSPSKGFDCSGFTQYVYKHFGISINRSSGAQIKNGVAVEKSELQPGDLVIFNNDANTKIGHVGIYVGDGNFIHASNPSDGVKITTLTSGYYHKRYVGARRVY